MTCRARVARRALASIATAVSLIAFSSRAAGAQCNGTTTPCTATINATASAVSSMSVTAMADALFPSIAAGQSSAQTSSVDPRTAGSNPGKLSINGTRSSSVRVTWSLPANLTFGANQLPVTSWKTCYKPDADDPMTSLCNSYAPAGTSLTQSTVNTLGATNGSLYWYLGGALTGTNVPAGTYTAPVNVSVVYIGF